MYRLTRDAPSQAPRGGQNSSFFRRASRRGRIRKPAVIVRATLNDDAATDDNDDVEKKGDLYCEKYAAAERSHVRPLYERLNSEGTAFNRIIIIAMRITLHVRVYLNEREKWELTEC